MDAETALQRMREVLRAGGTLAVLGLARGRYPADLPRDVVATLVSRAYRLSGRHWESPAPILWPPPHSYREVKLLAERTLPRARFPRRRPRRERASASIGRAVEPSPTRSAPAAQIRLSGDGPETGG